MIEVTPGDTLMRRTVRARVFGLTATFLLVSALPVLADVAVGLVQGINAANRQIFVQVAGKGVVPFRVTPKTTVKLANGKTIPVRTLGMGVVPAGTIAKITHQGGVASEIMLKAGATAKGAPAKKR
jgi:hypothetical protein